MTEIWIAKGLYYPWRVCSHAFTYGEFERVEDAKLFLEALLISQPEEFYRLEAAPAEPRRSVA